jgi:branched-subunit amino acid aminotransferase/4-amino-4-deoxychorismate lyase
LTVAQGANDATDVLITAQPLTQYPDSLYQRGAYAIIAEIRRNPTSLLARIKSLNYLENLIIRKQAGAQGADEAIFLDADGCLAEGTASNLFWAESDVIYTPSLDCPILPGVTRAFVIQLAHQCGYRVEQGKWKLANLLTADEAFLTNSLMEVMPLTRLNPHLIGDRRPGQMTLTLKRLYRNEVEKQLSSESLVAYKSSQ